MPPLTARNHGGLSMLITLIPFLISLTGSPGPSNILVLVTSINFGYQRTIPLILGLISGLALMIVALGVGLSQIFTAYPAVHTVLKVISITYLLYLAWKIAWSGSLHLNSESAKAMSFVEGLLFQTTNPKAWFGAISIVASYTTDETDILSQVLFIAVLFLIIAFICLSVWAIFGYVFARFLQSPRVRHVFNVALALVLVLSLVPLIV